jgi:hypothetical protein
MMLHPLNQLGSYGYQDPNWKGPQGFPLETMSALGYLKSPWRRASVIERWSPYEIALFEAALAIHGKDFGKIAKAHIQTKTTKEVIEFYYIWKKTSHYRKWKAQYIPEYLDVSDDDDEEVKEEEAKANDDAQK